MTARIPLRMCTTLVVLAACAACSASPSPRFLGTSPVETERDGRRYVLWRDGNAVEVVRLGYARRGEHRAIRETMLALIPELTGCALAAGSAEGDSGVLRARVTCG